MTFFNLLFLPLKKAIVDTNQITWFSEDFYTLIFRLAVNLVFLTIIIRFLYYPRTKRKDYLFTYYLIEMNYRNSFNIVYYIIISYNLELAL